MRRYACISIFILAALLVSFSAAGSVGVGNEGTGSVPRVAYARPQSQSVVDISDGKGVVFEWQPLPIPSGSRECYRFVLHKGTGYQLVESRIVDPRTFSIEVPAGKLEDGKEYWWYVRQRDARTMTWSEYDIWYFKAVKGDKR